MGSPANRSSLIARNIEIKASVDALEDVEPAVAALADSGPVLIDQDDVFFACATGRLKLRDFGDGSGELIAYERADKAGPKASSYSRIRTSDPAGLRDALAKSLGVTGRVRKTRKLYTTGRTRIHLDRVVDLGDYLELEVVLGADENEAGGIAEAERLMTWLGIDPNRLCDRAYADLLAERFD